MLELEYQGGNRKKRWRRPNVDFRVFELAGTTADLEDLIANLTAVADDGSPSVAPISEDGAAAWLVIARSDGDLELVHLDRGVLLAGDAETLRDVASQTEWCVRQGRGPRPLNGYHAHIDLHDVHNLSRGRLHYGGVGELKVYWVHEGGTPGSRGGE